jgi:hypothetical protein
MAPYIVHCTDGSVHCTERWNSLIYGALEASVKKIVEKLFDFNDLKAFWSSLHFSKLESSLSAVERIVLSTVTVQCTMYRAICTLYRWLRPCGLHSWSPLRIKQTSTMDDEFAPAMGAKCLANKPLRCASTPKIQPQKFVSSSAFTKLERFTWWENQQKRLLKKEANCR